MKCIEYRYTQAINSLKAIVQLGTDGKYWNESKGKWQDALDKGCYMQLVELSNANVFNSNIDKFDFMTLYKNIIEDGLYVYASEFLNIVIPGQMTSPEEMVTSVITRHFSEVGVMRTAFPWCP